MKNKISFFLIFYLFLGITSFAQKDKLTREDKDEKNLARTERVNNKNDVALFRKQIMALKEYAMERQKIPALQKTSKMAVKVTAVIDTDATDNAADSKTLIGYIRQDVGDNTTNMYELIYDRAQKKIVSVTRTPEAAETDKEATEEKEDMTTTKKTKAKKSNKKNQDEDEDNDPDEEKPSKKKDKDDD